MMKRFGAIIFIICVIAMPSLQGDSGVGPLPPITVSLDAPIRIDEDNTHHQELMMSESPSRLKQVLGEKRFPVEIVLVALLLLMVYLFFKNRNPAPKVEPPALITPAERLEQAAMILAKADDLLSREEALSIVYLLDPLMDTPPYYQLSEQIKFAAYLPKKSEIKSVIY